MSDPVRFLNAFAQALGVMTLYPDGHPSRERAVDAAFERVRTALARSAVRIRRSRSSTTKWCSGGSACASSSRGTGASRLVAAGVQRLEFERKVTRDEFDGLPRTKMLARLMLSSIDTSEARQMRSLGIRFGAVGLQGQERDRRRTGSCVEMATLDAHARRGGGDIPLAAEPRCRSSGSVPSARG